MELQEQINALQAEKKQYISTIDDLNAEKIALDQMLVSSLKESLEAKKNVLLKSAAIDSLNNQIQELFKEKESTNQEILKLKETLSMMASNAN